MQKFTRVCSLLILAIFFAACGSTEQIFLPSGDTQAGKQVFTDFQCFSCHEVYGEEYPDPSAITPTYVPLGDTGNVLSRYELAEAVIAPSHQFARPIAPEGKIVGDQNIKSGNRSRMTDFSGRMTVRQLLDLVAYLEELQTDQSAQVASLE